MRVRQLSVCLLAIAAAAHAEVSRFDTTTQVLSIPSVDVGPSTFVNLTLLHTGNFVFALKSATERKAAGGGQARFDLSNNLLSLPAVKVGDSTFVDLTLQHIGNFNFQLLSAAEFPPTTTSELLSLLAQNDALWASAVPTASSTRLALLDACYLDAGRTKAWLASDLDGNVAEAQARDAYRIGQHVGNLQVLGQRTLNNPDGSTRREVDVEYDVTYVDGSVARAVSTTMISGSSAGSSGCTTPQTGTAWRFFGNRQLVQTSVRSRNTRDERYLVSTGAAASPALNYRRDLQFYVTDPMGNATYVIVSGPGPSATVNGQTVPFSLKLLSPLVLRSAPELAGKSGNFLNWVDDDGFRFCRVSGTGVPVASAADCVGLGTGSNSWGVTTSTPNAVADQNHVDQGFVAGGLYTFDVYNDDGWKTVNGHAGRTPVARYNTVLAKLSYPFVEMAGSGPTADKFPRLSFGALNKVQLRDKVVGSASSTVNLSWTALGGLSDGERHALFQGWQYEQGAKVGNSGGAFYPAYRWTWSQYPGASALALSNWPLIPKPTEISSVSYFEFTLLWLDRDDGQVLSTVSFQ